MQIESQPADDSVIYKWRVMDGEQVILESRVPFKDWNECYRDAAAAVDEYICSTDNNSLKT